MTAQNPAGKAAPIRTYKIIVLTLCGALVGYGLVFAEIVSGTDAPQPWVLLVLGALTVVAFALAQGPGMGASALDPAMPAEEAEVRVLRAFALSTFLRLALSESVALIGLVLAVALDNITTNAVAVALSLILMVVNVWPSDRVVARVETSLDRNGARSHLRDLLNGDPPGTSSPGAILY